MDPFTFIWATEEPPLPPKYVKGGKPILAALEEGFGVFTDGKPKRQRGKKAARMKRAARSKRVDP